MTKFRKPVAKLINFTAEELREAAQEFKTYNVWTHPSEAQKEYLDAFVMCLINDAEKAKENQAVKVIESLLATHNTNSPPSQD